MNFKKILLIVFSILFIFILFGQFSNNQKWKSFENNTFSTDFEWTKDLMDGYSDQETAIELSFAGPFYFPQFDGINEYSRMYSLARKDRVNQINTVVGESIDYLNDLEDYTKEYRGIFDWYIFKITTLSEGSREVFLPYLDESTESALSINLHLELLNTLKKELNDFPKTPEEGFLTYTKYVSTLKLIDEYKRENKDLNTKFLAIYTLLEDNNNVYKSINKELYTKLKPVNDKINQLFIKLNFNKESLLHEEKLLFTADYYFAKDSLNFMKIESEKLGKKLAKYNGENKNLDKESYEYILEIKNAFDFYIDSLEKYLISVPNTKLLSDTEVSTTLNICTNTYAFSNPITWFRKKVESAAGSAYKMSKEVGSFALDTAVGATKYYGNKALDLTVATTKVIGKTIGPVLDTAGAVVKTGSDGFWNTVYGNDQMFYKEDTYNNFKKIVTNFEKGKSGAETYATAVSMFDDLENNAEKLTGGFIKSTLGEGRTSSIVGGVAKIGVGFFTGFAKDALTAINPKTSKSSTLFALTNMVVTLSGGSQSILKVSNLTPNLSKQLMKSTSKTVLRNGLENMTTKVLKDSLINTVKKTFSRNILKDLGKLSKNIYKNTKESFINNIKNFGFKSIKKDVIKTYKTFKYEGTFKEAIINTLGMGDGAGLVGLIDNTVGNYIDNHIKNYFKKGMNSLTGNDRKTYLENKYKELRKRYKDELDAVLTNNFDDFNIENNLGDEEEYEDKEGDDEEEDYDNEIKYEDYEGQGEGYFEDYEDEDYEDEDNYQDDDINKYYYDEFGNEYIRDDYNNNYEDGYEYIDEPTNLGNLGDKLKTQAIGDRDRGLRDDPRYKDIYKSYDLAPKDDRTEEEIMKAMEESFENMY